MSITIYYDRSYAFGTVHVLEYAVGSCTWHRVYEIYPRPPRAADQFPSLAVPSNSFTGSESDGNRFGREN